MSICFLEWLKAAYSRGWEWEKGCQQDRDKKKRQTRKSLQLSQELRERYATNFKTAAPRLFAYIKALINRIFANQGERAMPRSFKCATKRKYSRFDKNQNKKRQKKRFSNMYENPHIPRSPSACLVPSTFLSFFFSFFFSWGFCL